MDRLFRRNAKEEFLCSTDTLWRAFEGTGLDMIVVYMLGERDVDSPFDMDVSGVEEYWKSLQEVVCGRWMDELALRPTSKCFLMLSFSLSYLLFSDYSHAW